MPSALVEPALWPDDLNYLIHVYEVPGAPVWHYVNMAGVKGYISLLPMLEAWAWVHLVPSPAWTPYLFVGSSLLFRSTERRVGKECGSTCRSRGSPSHSKKNN